MLILGTREILVGKNSKIKRGLFSHCCARNLGTQLPLLLMVVVSPDLPCISGTTQWGPAQQNGGPAQVQPLEIPQLSAVQLNDTRQPQSRAITSWLQPSKPSQSASMLSVSQQYRKYGHSNNPMELRRMPPEFPDFSYAQLGTKIPEQLGTPLHVQAVFCHLNGT